ncbi:MAG: hypothetical protein MAG471_01006 [Acidimicrobiaceae bacterium]|nr:hypothetical protein [Acidimicrobiaceae bacterium]
MQGGVGGNRIASVGGDVACHVGEHPTGLGQDGQHRRHIPSVDDGVDHGVGAAGSHEQVAVRVPPGSDNGTGCHQWVQTGGRSPVVDPACDDAGASQIRPVSDPGGSAIGETAKAPSGPDALAERRNVDDTHGRTVFVLEGHEVAEQGNPLDERDGSVDRVEDPGATRGACPVCLLLADDRVVGVGTRDALSQQPFSPSVRDRHRASVVLVLDIQVGVAEESEGQVTGLAGNRHGEVDKVLANRWECSCHGSQAYGPVRYSRVALAERLNYDPSSQCSGEQGSADSGVCTGARSEAASSFPTSESRTWISAPRSRSS